MAQSPIMNMYHAVAKYIPALEFGPQTTHELVGYTAASCPHSQELLKGWPMLEKSWAEAETKHLVPGSLRMSVKECLNKDWANGKDAAFCQENRVESFPTLRLYDKRGKGPKLLGEFDGERKMASILDWVDQVLQKSGLKAPKTSNGDSTSNVSSGDALLTSHSLHAKASSVQGVLPAVLFFLPSFKRGARDKGMKVRTIVSEASFL